MFTTIKLWIIGIAAVSVLTFGAIWWHKHNVAEQTIGAKTEATAVTKVATAAEKQVTAGTAAAETTETHNANAETAAVAAPPVSSVGIVCQHEGPAGSHHNPLPQAGTVPASGAGEPGTDGPIGPPYDPSGAILTRARSADAQIAYLQARIHELEAQMNASP